jgi:hypothetical protein
MDDESKAGEAKKSFNIPPPRIEELEVSKADRNSLAGAVQELRGYDSGHKSALTRSWWDWIQVHLLKWILFGFVVGINIWWTKNILRILWLSGSEGSHFHMDNNVLIALVSTSIANFLALVLVVAKNLFPDSSK